MSTERDPLTLATEALARHNFESEWGEIANPWDEHPAEIKRGWLSEALKQAKVVAEHFQPQQVTTVEELDALPNGTILLASDRYPRYRWTLWRVKSGGMIEQVGHELKGVTPFRYFVDPLPATVLHVGGAE